ncbi:hypothetical protein ACVDG8_001740 [Mesorhizobium sp. ORM8.1]
MNTAIGSAILNPTSEAEQEAIIIQHADDQAMIRALQHGYAVEQSLDWDVQNWDRITMDKPEQTIKWLQERNTNPDVVITPSDYRTHARRLAASLLLMVSKDLSVQHDHRAANEDKWDKNQRSEYWRCVAICSSAWGEQA